LSLFEEISPWAKTITRENEHPDVTVARMTVQDKRASWPKIQFLS